MRKIRTEYVVYCDACNRDVRVTEATPNATLKDDEFYFCPDCLAKIRDVIDGKLRLIFLPPDQDVTITQKSENSFDRAKAVFEEEVTKKIGEVVMTDLIEPEIKKMTDSTDVKEEPEVSEDTEDNGEVTLVKNTDARFIKAGLNSKVWTPSMLNELVQLCSKNYDLRQLAKHFGKTTEAMRATMSRIRNAKPGSDFYPVTRALDRMGYKYPTGNTREKALESGIIEAAIGLENGETAEELAKRLNVHITSAYRYQKMAKEKGLVPEKKGGRFI